VAGAGHERERLIVVEAAVALHHRARPDRGAEAEAGAELVVDVAKVLAEEELVLADVDRRRAGSGGAVERVSEEWRDLAVREQVDVDVEHVAIAVVRVLAGDDPLAEERVRELRQRAEEIRAAVAEADAVLAGFAGVDAQHARGARADIVRVDAEVFDE